MQYGEVRRGVFIARPNRFIAHVEMGGKTVVCHVKNTGRCRELLVPGAPVCLERGRTAHRKTEWDLIAVEKGSRLINMDAQAPNRVFTEFARQYEPETAVIHPEYTVGRSRLDFCLELTDGGRHYVEVKGVTLEEDGRNYFPDAPTERGIRHLEELIRLRQEGHRATVFFVIQMQDVCSFSPNDRTHPAFGATLRKAAAAGVRVAAYQCRATPESLTISDPVPVILQ
jgi:sugar fermentation stimulation protein A